MKVLLTFYGEETIEQDSSPEEIAHDVRRLGGVRRGRAKRPAC